MPRRRLTSRSVVLTATFLTLAAGGAAACDATDSDDGAEGFVSGPGEPAAAPVPDQVVEPDPADDAGSDDADADDDGSDPGDEVFYCADTDGEIVDESLCDGDADGATYLFWHSPGYRRGLRVGTVLDGGEQFAAGDRGSRRAFGLPASGRIGNGTIKTNVVGRSSGGSGTVGASAGG